MVRGVSGVLERFMSFRTYMRWGSGVRRGGRRRRRGGAERGRPPGRGDRHRGSGCGSAIAMEKSTISRSCDDSCGIGGLFAGNV